MVLGTECNKAEFLAEINRPKELSEKLNLKELNLENLEPRIDYSFQKDPGKDKQLGQFFDSEEEESEDTHFTELEQHMRDIFRDFL